MADAWANQGDGYESYFFKNIQHGIRTADDGLIWKRIEGLAPAWLTDPDHREAVMLLRREALA